MPKGERSGKNHPCYKGNDIGIVRRHDKIKKIKGPAKNYKCIGDGINQCNKQAQHWSNANHKYSLNPDDYQPRCMKCHFAYDKKFNNSIRGLVNK